MKYSIDFLIDFNTRDIPSIGHDPRNWIGFRSGVNMVDALDQFDNLIYSGALQERKDAKKS